MIELLISILIICLIGALIFYALKLLPVPEPFRTIILCIVVLILVLVLLSYLPVGPWWHRVA